MAHTPTTIVAPDDDNENAHHHHRHRSTRWRWQKGFYYLITTQQRASKGPNDGITVAWALLLLIHDAGTNTKSKGQGLQGQDRGYELTSIQSLLFYSPVSFFIPDLSFQQQSSTMSELKFRRLTEHNHYLPLPSASN